MTRRKELFDIRDAGKEQGKRVQTENITLNGAVPGHSISLIFGLGSQNSPGGSQRRLAETGVIDAGPSERWGPATATQATKWSRPSSQPKLSTLAPYLNQSPRRAVLRPGSGILRSRFLSPEGRSAIASEGVVPFLRLRMTAESIKILPLRHFLQGHKVLLDAAIADFEAVEP